MATVLLPEPIDLKIGVDGISCLEFAGSSLDDDDRNPILAVGTCGGRVRVFRSNVDRDSDKSFSYQCFHQRRWHKSIRCLSFLPSSSSSSLLLATCSSQGGIKVHDVATDLCQRVWSNLEGHGRVAISSLLTLPQQPGRFVTADENGIIKLWDLRRAKPCMTLNSTSPSSEGEGSFVAQFEAINALAMGNGPSSSSDEGSSPSHSDLLLAAVDDGTLATFSLRQRQLYSLSDTLGYSARSVVVVKEGQKVLVGTDEGVIACFTWGEFGNLCDRFPVHSMCPSKLGNARTLPPGSLCIEKIVKLSEDIIAVITDEGTISCFNILPNRLLGRIGWHRLSSNNNNNNDLDNSSSSDLDLGNGDCFSLTKSSSCLASASSGRPTITFWSYGHLLEMAIHDSLDLKRPAKQRKLERSRIKGVEARKSIIRNAEQRTTALDSRRAHLSGLIGSDDQDDDAESDDSDQDDDQDSIDDDADELSQEEEIIDLEDD